MKKCWCCKKDKDDRAFGKDKSRKDGMSHTCRTCRSDLESSEAYKIKQRANFKKNYDKNIEDSRHNQRMRYNRNKFSVKTRFRDYKRRARLKGWTLTLSLDKFERLTSQSCRYCGGFYSEECRHTGLDRINSFKGYEEDNVVPCCKWCNYFRNRMSVKDFLEHVEKIHEHQHLEKKHYG